MHSDHDTCEVNFDGLIGPTHNYSGLSQGNLASQSNALQVANPRDAALQGLDKMTALLDRGFVQGFFPPQQRPRLDLLRKLGFSGSDKKILNGVARTQPSLLSLVYSASSMWAANAATVTASKDTLDGRVHFTPANLLTTPHRAIEHEETTHCLRTLFADETHFCVHPTLPSIAVFGDEGAANHNRLCLTHGGEGLYVYVYGRESGAPANLQFPARQTRLASEAVARQHGLADNAVFLPQSTTAINAGAFHNDVVAVANESVLFYHQDAFACGLEQLHETAARQDLTLCDIQVANADVSLNDAVQSYLFNSQLLTRPNSTEMLLIAPQECELNPRVHSYLKTLVQDTSNPIADVRFLNLKQSMRNGGGPACLRLRVVMNSAERAACHPAFLLDQAKIEQLRQWVTTYYRDRLCPDDLADPQLLDESYTALEALTAMLGLGSYYHFQR